MQPGGCIAYLRLRREKGKSFDERRKSFDAKTQRRKVKAIRKRATEDRSSFSDRG